LLLQLQHVQLLLLQYDMLWNITIAAYFAIEIRRGRCHILEFSPKRRALQQVQIARQK